MTELQRSVAESYRGATFHFKKWELRRCDWDHDHCQLCWARMSDLEHPQVQNEGYVTYVPTEPEEPRPVPKNFQAPAGLDFTGYTMTPAPVVKGYAEHWICISCFLSFRDQLEAGAGSGPRSGFIRATIVFGSPPDRQPPRFPAGEESPVSAG